jgi:gamma-tubulin complex component 5
MARVTPEIEFLTGQLIERLSGFQDGHPNHRTCLQYALSNLRFHRFLDVDSLKVSRKIKRLCFKFSVHSQDDKSERFRALTDSFLASPLFYSDPDSDHHYALILMMTLLGDCPTQSEYGEEEKCVEVVEDEINWQEELCHDTSNWTLFSHVDNEESWSDSEENEGMHDAVMALHLMSEKENEGNEKQPDTQPTTNQGDGKHHDFSKAFHDQLVPQYWNSEAMNDAKSLTPKWMVGIKSDPSCQTLTESVVLRETLWCVRPLYLSCLFVHVMLLGNENDFATTGACWSLRLLHD